MLPLVYGILPPNYKMPMQHTTNSWKFFLESKLHAFPKQKVKNKNKTLNSFWITKGLQRSSKGKQKLYEKFLKKNKQNQ